MKILRFSFPAVIRPVPLHPPLLASKDPENPAGEVLGFGLGKLIGVLFEDGETEITSKDITILKKKIIQTERI
jgi:hypothetical protein